MIDWFHRHMILTLQVVVGKETGCWMTLEMSATGHGVAAWKLTNLETSPAAKATDSSPTSAIDSRISGTSQADDTEEFQGRGTAKK